MALGKDGDSIRIFAGILDTPWVLELGPLFQMNPIRRSCCCCSARCA